MLEAGSKPSSTQTDRGGSAEPRAMWQPMRCRIALVGFLTVALSLTADGWAREARGQISTASEYRLKAAYLYNFLVFFSWPEETFSGPQAPLVVGVFGDGPLGAALDEVARRKTVKGRRIVVRRFKSWKDYRPCHMLFLPRTVGQNALAEAIKRTRGSPLLLVGETPGLARRGATVNFYPDIDGTIGFEINVDATAERKLGVDARLLKLARIIKRRPPPGGGG